MQEWLCVCLSVEEVALEDYEIPLSQAEVVETGEKTEGMIVSCML